MNGTSVGSLLKLKNSSVFLFAPVAHLFGDQHVVDSLLREQLLMRPLFDHHSSLEDSDAVCVLDGGQAVGHDDARPALAGMVQRLLHHLERAEW